MKKILYKLPRILGIIYILFISVFALDVITEQRAVIAFLMHMLPSIGLLLVLILAWKRPFIGGFIYIILGLGYGYMIYGEKNMIAFLAISAPLFVIGFLFWLQGLFIKK